MKNKTIILLACLCSMAASARSADSTATSKGDFSLTISARNLSPKSGQQGLKKAVIAPEFGGPSSFNPTLMLLMEYKFFPLNVWDVAIVYAGSYSDVQLFSTVGVNVRYKILSAGLLYGVTAHRIQNNVQYRGLSLNFDKGTTWGFASEANFPFLQSSCKVQKMNSEFFFTGKLLAPVITFPFPWSHTFLCPQVGALYETSVGAGLMVGVKIGNHLQTLVGFANPVTSDVKKYRSFRSIFFSLACKI